MTVFKPGEGKFLGSNRTIAAIVGSDEVQVLGIIGNHIPFDEDLLAANIAALMNGTAPKDGLKVKAMRAGYIKSVNGEMMPNGIELYFQTGEAHDDKQRVSLSVMAQGDTDLKGQVLAKLHDASFMEDLLGSFKVEPVQVSAPSRKAERAPENI